MTKSAWGESFREDLPAALGLLRQARGLSQEDLAQELDIHKTLVSRYETGDRTPGSGRLSAILEALGADWNDLQAALDEVRHAESEGQLASPDALTFDEATTQETLMVAFLEAAEDGRAEEFVNRMIEQTRYVTRLYDRLKKRKAASDQSSEGNPEPTDPAIPAKSASR